MSASMVAPEPITVTLPPLHAGQMAIAKHPARFKVVCCGRRWGKTLLAMTMCLRAALKGKRIWHVAPTYKQTLEGWTYLQRLIAQMPASLAKTHVSELTVRFAGGGSIQLRTAENPDNLRGAGLDGVVLDEAATIRPEAWDLVLRPALADRQGWALFISTPQHYNWFYDLYSHAESMQNEDWAAWQHPTWTNPYIPEEEIEAARRDMDPDDFEQEFGASFTAVGGAVWPLLARDRMWYLRERPAGLEFQRVGVGMDWGTTEGHKAAVVCAGLLRSGEVWILSAWQDPSGEDYRWFDEAERCHTDYRATIARVDRSQSSAKGRIQTKGYGDVDTGVADVEARNGAFGGLVGKRRIFFDLKGPGVRDYYTRCTEYHKYPEGHLKAGKIVEENDDDVDAGCYIVAELVDAGVQVGTAGWQSSPARGRLGGFRSVGN